MGGGSIGTDQAYPFLVKEILFFALDHFKFQSYFIFFQMMNDSSFENIKIP